jgi:two-component system, response regulator
MVHVKKILLVDDNPKDVELTIEALTEHSLANGLIVLADDVEALDYQQYNGKSGNRKKEIPAVILMGIKMPRMDGIEALRANRGDPLLKSIPLVMLTSSREDPDLKKCYELGVNA